MRRLLWMLSLFVDGRVLHPRDSRRGARGELVGVSRARLLLFRNLLRFEGLARYSILAGQ